MVAAHRFTTSLCFWTAIVAAGCQPEVQTAEVMAQQKLPGAGLASVTSKGSLCPSGTLVASAQLAKADLPFPVSALTKNSVSVQGTAADCTIGFTFIVPKGYQMTAPPLNFKGAAIMDQPTGTATRLNLKADFVVSQVGEASQALPGKWNSDGSSASSDPLNWSVFVEPTVQSRCAQADSSVTWVYKLSLTSKRVGSASTAPRITLDSIDAANFNSGDLVQYSKCG